MKSQPHSPFPQDFIWGAATAAYQVEGAHDTDGRGPSIWDTFCRQPGRIIGDDNADSTVEQYHLYKDDVQLMKWLGLKAYRFSVSWPRVLPNGKGTPNEKGLDYYDRLVDELLGNGIQPWMTLFHWDLPQALQDEYGGWANPRIADDFADYATLIAKRFSDRVTNFFTVNEFFCFIDKGYGMGNEFDAFAPGLKLPAKELNQAKHHALLSHGRAVQALRAHAKQSIKVGLAENSSVCCPLIETPENIAAARKAFREINAHYITAVMEGRYLDCYLNGQGADAPAFTDEEMKIISSPLDFVGMNMYAPTFVQHSDEEKGYEIVPWSPSHPKMHMPWLALGPQITYWAPRFCKELWNVENFYITENGCAADDRPDLQGRIQDTDRVIYLREHFISASRAVSEGWPLKGYFVWSLLDNFEWAYGHSRRFGLTYVNYKTLERTPKLSAHWYRQVISKSAIS